MKKVVIVQRNLPHYRKKFFELLREGLQRDGIDLLVIYGAQTHKHLIVDAPDWALYKPMLWIGNLFWHRDCKQAWEADLLIAPQEVKSLSNLALFIRSRFTKQKFAYWGHGKNCQSANLNGIAERWKRFLSKRVDWWFAYNDWSADIVRQLGYPSARISSLQNSIDTENLKALDQEVTQEQLVDLRKQLGITTDNVAVYTGGLNQRKRIPFLIKASELIRESVPDFELLIIGDGESRAEAEEAAAKYSWIRWLGKLNDKEKLPYWRISKFVAMPGLVGLVVVDTFVLGVPMITTTYPYHSPEFSYLKNGQNGVISEDWQDVEAYAAACVRVLTDHDYHSELVLGCLESANSYSVEAMAENMIDGIKRVLASGGNEDKK